MSFAAGLFYYGAGVEEDLPRCSSKPHRIFRLFNHVMLRMSPAILSSFPPLLYHGAGRRVTRFVRLNSYEIAGHDSPNTGPLSGTELASGVKPCTEAADA